MGRFKATTSQNRNLNPYRKIPPTTSPPIDIYSRFHFPAISSDDLMINRRFHRFMNGRGAGNSKVCYRGQPPPPPPPRRAVYRRQVEDDVTVYRRFVEDDLSDRRHLEGDMAVGSYGSDDLPEAISYKSQVLEEPSPQRTQKPPVIKDQNNNSTKFTPKYSDWSPLDDGIDINPTFTSSRETFNACVDFTLYGPSPRERLPVFASFCPE